jgi:hypothetical protein
MPADDIVADPGFGCADALLKGIIQESSSKPVPSQSRINPATLIEEIKLKLAATSSELAAVPSEAIAGSAAAGLPGDVAIFARRLHLRQLMFIYQGQLARLASLQVRQQRRLELENQAANWSGFSETSPHPFLRTDELKESVTNLSSRVDEIETWIPAIDQAGLQVVTVAENSTAKLRPADEAIERAKESPDQQALLGRERDLLALQNQIDLARAMGYQIEKQTVQEELLETRAQLQLARKQLSVASEHVALTQQDIDQVQKKIELENQHIVDELKQAVSALDLENKSGQQEKLASSVSGEAAQQQSAEPEQIDQIRQTQRNTTDIKLQTLNWLLVYVQMQRDIWNLRWEFAKVADREKAAEAYDRIAKNQAILKVVHDYVNQQRHSVLELITSQTAKELDPTVSGPDALRDQLRKLELDQVISYSRLLGVIESTEGLLQRCKQELDERFAVILHAVTIADFPNS